MKNKHNLFKPELNIFHLIIFGIFIIALGIRLYGAKVFALTNAEAEALLSASNIKPYETESFFYDLIIKLMLFLGIYSNLGLRLVNVFSGSLIIILPAFFSKEFGKKTAILTSLFFAFDPFGIANSIVFSGNALTLLLVGFFIESVVHNRNYFTLSFAALLVGHSRGLGYVFITSCLLILILLLYDRNAFKNIQIFVKERIFSNQKSFLSIVIILLILILSIITKGSISTSASDIVHMMTAWSLNYEIGNYPIVYPFAIISYIPFVLFIPLLFFLKIPKPEFRFIKLAFIWFALTFLIITFFPRHLIIDLVWVSLPLWVIMALFVSKLLHSRIHIGEEDLPFLGILIAAGLNFGLNIVSLVYRSIWGMEITNTLLAILLISIFIIIMLLYRAYTTSLSKTLSAFLIVIFFLSGLFQVSISARTAGANQKPENEIIWNGYFEGQNIAEDIVQTFRTRIFGTTGLMNVFFDDQIYPSVVWMQYMDKLFFQKSDIRFIKPEVAFTSDRTTFLNENSYQGQEFISKSYPIWTWDPVRSFSSTDFWNWFFFRNNLQYKEYNFIWVKKT